MIRFVLLLILILAVLAVRYLPWWALIFPPLVIFSSLYFFGGTLLTALFSIPFRMKGKVLRGASATVNSIRAIPQPADNGALVDEEDETHDASLADVYDYYELDVTIRPKTPRGQFLGWEPSELTLTSLGSTMPLNDDQSCSIIELKVLPPEILEAQRGTLIESVRTENHANADEDTREHYDADEEDDNVDADGGKFFGAQRLMMQIGVTRGMKKLVFNYYFEKFGTVTLP